MKMNSQKIKENNRYFNAFIADSINRLNKGDTIICFNKDQIEEIQRCMKLNIIYDTINRWYVLSKEEEYEF